MTDLRTAVQQALEALGKWSIGYHVDAVELNDLIATLEAALEQPEQTDWQHLKRYGYAPGKYMSKCHSCGDVPVMDKRAITCRSCAEAMHAAALEPVAWSYLYSDGFWRFSNGARVNGCDPVEAQPLYTHPPRREWRGLTEEDERAFLDSVVGSLPVAKNLIRAIEAALKERNA